MTDNFLHAQFADLLRRRGFFNDETARRWTNPNELHIVVSYREDEYTVNGFAARTRNFNLRECAKFETALHSLMVGSSSRDKFKAVYDWVTGACEELTAMYPHTNFFVRMNDKAEPIVWLTYNGIDDCMQVAHSEYLMDKAKNHTGGKWIVLLAYMQENGFYQDLEDLPKLEREDNMTIYVKRDRLQNCQLVQLCNVSEIETIQFTTRTSVTDDGNLSDDAVDILVPVDVKHEYIAFTCDLQ